VWSRMPVVGPPLTTVPPEPLRWPLVKSVALAYEYGDRSQERGQRRGLLPRFVTNAYGQYGAHNGAIRSE